MTTDKLFTWAPTIIAPGLWKLGETPLRPTMDLSHRMPLPAHAKLIGGDGPQIDHLRERVGRELELVGAREILPTSAFNPGRDGLAERWHTDGPTRGSHVALLVLGPDGTPGTMFDTIVRVQPTGKECAHVPPRAHIFHGTGGTLYLASKTVPHASPVRTMNSLMLRWWFDLDEDELALQLAA